MPDTPFHEFEDTPASRAELIAFLKRPGGLVPIQGTWEQRLSHWWDQNPFAALHPYRGRVLRHEGKLIGYGGSVPTSYAFEGKQVPAIIATTLDVSPEFPKAGLSILLKMRSLSEDTLMCQTTPIPKLRHTLVRMGALAETQVQRRFFLLGTLGKFTRWPRLDAGMQLVTSLDSVRALSRPFQKADRLEKWHTPESLRWQLATPTREQAFLGAVDALGTLHSILILTPRRVRGLRAWDVLESFTTRDDFSELHALAGALIRQPDLLSPQVRVLTAATFPQDLSWQGTPAVLKRQNQVCHFFLLPEHLRSVPKHSVMAEGDFVL